VEERPFLRIKNRLLGKDAVIRQFPKQLPSPPPDATNDEENGSTSTDNTDTKRAQWRDDLLMDFEAFDGLLIRLQLLKDSNERERQRYAVEKSKILETAQAVRDNITELRKQLVEAHRMLALRKEYDVLADTITSNNTLKPREEQNVALEKLNAEIAELDVEGREYGNLWAERRAQFGRVVEEGQVLIKVIRGEKDEDDAEEMEDREDGEASTSKGEGSQTGTPRPDAGDATPMRTPMDSDDIVPAASQNLLLRRAVGRGATTPAVAGSREASPTVVHEVETQKDTDMGDAAADGLEEGETADVHPPAGSEQMDTT